MVKRIALIITAAASVLAVALPASAAHQAQHRRVFGGKELVSQATSPLCAYGDGVVGDSTFGKDCVGSNAEIWSTVGSDICNNNHFVSANCPFTPGLNLNSYFLGDQIVYISNDHSNLVWRVDPSIWQSSVLSTGTNFVLHGDCGGTSGCQIISVRDTNLLGQVNTYSGVCSEGADLRLFDENRGTAQIPPGRCLWDTATP